MLPLKYIIGITVFIILFYFIFFNTETIIKETLDNVNDINYHKDDDMNIIYTDENK
jgi:hypothetical protein